MNMKEQVQDSPSATTMLMRCSIQYGMQRGSTTIQKREWNKMVDRAMAADFSWNNSARQYEEMYNWLIGDKPE